MYKQDKTIEFFAILYLYANLCIKLDFQKVDYQKGGKWVNHDIKHCKDN